MFFRGLKLTAAVVFLFATGTVSAGNNWQEISDGLSYSKIIVRPAASVEYPVPAGQIHLFMVDPAKLRLDITPASDLGLQSIDAKTVLLKKNALVAINGGFFSPDFKHLGLIVSNGRELNKIKWISWWHIFNVKTKTPSIITKQDYAYSPEIEMAIEAGPRLIVDGNIPQGLKQSIAERTGLGITADNKIIIAATESAMIGMAEFAKYLKDAGAVSAINLDGGSSTQIYAKTGGFELQRPGLSSVANVIGVYRR